MSQSPPKDTAGSSSMSIVIKAKKSCPVILLLVRWTKWLCRASASMRSGGNVPAHFSLIFPANCLGSRLIVMRIVLLDDVICAKHIVRDVLMMSKTLDNAELLGRVFISLMHMPFHPATSPIGTPRTTEAGKVSGRRATSEAPQDGQCGSRSGAEYRRRWGSEAKATHGREGAVGQSVQWADTRE